MARVTSRISGADFVTSNSVPITVLDTQSASKVVVARQLVVELVPGDVAFADGGVLQLVLGDNTAVDTTIGVTTYGAVVAKITEQNLSLGVIDIADAQAGPVTVQLKTTDIDASGGVATVAIAAGGTGYVAGDTGTIVAPGAGIDAEYIVTTVALGVVTGLTITATGSGHAVANGITTVATTGAGNDDLTVNILTLSWDGEVKVTFYYSLPFVG